MTRPSKSRILVTNTLGGKFVDVTGRTDGDGIIYNQTTDQYEHEALAKIADVTFETIDANGDVGRNPDQFAPGDHTHAETEVNITSGTGATETLQGLNSYTGIPHISSGGVITDLGTGSISITEAMAYVKTSNSAAAILEAVIVPATTIVIPADQNIIIYVDYNAGTPQFSSRVSTAGYFYYNWDELPFATTVNLGTSIIVRDFKSTSINAVYKNILGQINYEAVRYLGGLEVTDEGVRQFSTAVGAVLYGNDYGVINPLDTSSAGTFTRMYYDGANWVRTTGQSTVDNTQYNDITSGLVTLSSDAFTNKWLYYVEDDPSFWIVLDDQAQYDYYASAYSVTAPSLLPPELSAFYAGSILVGKFIVQEGKTEFVDIQNPFSSNYGVALPSLNKSYSFTSQGVGAGTFYLGGYYDIATTDANLTQAALTQTFGTTNASYAAHAFTVAGGAGTVDTGVVGLRVTGTRIQDDGTRTPAYSYTIYDDITTATLNEYKEAPKFIGAVTYQLYVVSGTPTAYSFDFNYGFVKYEDFSNNDFDLLGFEVVGVAGATDAGFNITLIHHNDQDWVYAATGFAITPTVITDLQTVHNTEYTLSNGKPFAFKLAPLAYSSVIAGKDTEGIITRVVTTANNSVQSMDIHIGARIIA